MTLESQYKEFKLNNPDSALTFEEWYETKFSKLGDFVNHLQKHNYSVEHLYHFNCGGCRGWWSIGDYKPNRDNLLTCPHCGFKSEVNDLY